MKECTLCNRCYEDSFTLCLEDGGGLAQTYPGRAVLDGKYRLVRRLGQGGMGTVYRALHLGLERVVAVKLLRGSGEEDAARRESFLAEARALARLDHPNVVAVADFGVDVEAGIPYLVLELLAGRTLAERLRQGPLPVGEALAILSQVAAALDEVHARGILHQDLKAGNVWLTAEEPPRVKLLDFGLASRASEPTETALDPAAGTPFARHHHHAGTPLEVGLRGTPPSLAPELWRREPPSHATDIWAFGVLAYTALVGRPPFAGGDPATVRARVEQGAPRPSALSPALDACWDEPLLAPLQADPAARPARAGDAAAALAAVGHRVAARRQAPRRLAAAAVLGALAAGTLPWLETHLKAVEDRLVDLRFAAGPPRRPGEEIVLVRLDDATLREGPLGRPGEPLAAALERALAAGAAGVAFDLLLPAKWGDSPAFSALLVQRAGSVVLSAFTGPTGQVRGEEALAPGVVEVLGPERSRDLFGFVDVHPDGDGVVRRARLAGRDAEGRLRPYWTLRAAELLRRAPLAAERSIWIDSRLDAGAFAAVSAQELLEADPARWRGRLLLVGEDVEGVGDLHRVRQPGRGTRLLRGVELQALILETLLAGEPVRSAAPGWVRGLAGLGAGLAAAAALLARRGWAAPLVAAVLWLAAAWALFHGGGWMVPVAAPVAALALAGLAALALGRWALPARAGGGA